jgi:hypothetical protein
VRGETGLDGQCGGGQRGQRVAEPALGGGDRDDHLTVDAVDPGHALGVQPCGGRPAFSSSARSSMRTLDIVDSRRHLN